PSPQGPGFFAHPERAKILAKRTTTEMDNGTVKGDGASARTSVTAKCKHLHYSSMVENTS
ncbi:MAG: hypothetical protein ACREBC_24700, partial [Pyrinomonadaceae bacterium]